MRFDRRAAQHLYFALLLCATASGWRLSFCAELPHSRHSPPSASDGPSDDSGDYIVSLSMLAILAG